MLCLHARARIRPGAQLLRLSDQSTFTRPGAPVPRQQRPDTPPQRAIGLVPHRFQRRDHPLLEASRGPVAKRVKNLLADAHVLVAGHLEDTLPNLGQIALQMARAEVH